MSNPLTATAQQIAEQYAAAMRNLYDRPMLSTILEAEFTYPDTAEASVQMLYYVAFCAHTVEDVQVFRQHGLPSVSDARHQVTRLRRLLGEDELLRRYDGYVAKL